MPAEDPSALCRRAASLLSEGHLQQVCALAAEPEAEQDAGLALLIGQAAAGLGEIERADRAFDKAKMLILARDAGEHGAAIVELHRALCLGDLPDRRSALLTELERGLGVFVDYGDREHFGRGLALATRMWASLADWDKVLDRSQRLDQASATHQQPHGTLTARLYAALAFEALGDLHRARELLDSLPLDAGAPSGSLAALARATSSRLHARQGRPTQARAVAVRVAQEPHLPPVARAGLALLFGQGFSLDPSELDAALAEPLLLPFVAELFQHEVARAATREQARAQADRAVSLLHGASRSDLAALCEVAYARHLGADGDPARALEHLEALEATLPPWVHALADVARADLHLNLGQTGRAIAYVDAQARPLQDRGFLQHAALAHLKAARGLRLAGRIDQARDRLADSGAIAASLQSAELRALQALEGARIALVAGRADEARQRLEGLVDAQPAMAQAASLLGAQIELMEGRPRHCLELLEALELPWCSPALRAQGAALRFRAQRAAGVEPVLTEHIFNEAERLLRAAGLSAQADRLREEHDDPEGRARL